MGVEFSEWVYYELTFLVSSNTLAHVPSHIEPSSILNLNGIKFVGGTNIVTISFYVLTGTISINNTFWQKSGNVFSATGQGPDLITQLQGSAITYSAPVQQNDSLIIVSLHKNVLCLRIRLLTTMTQLHL
jgi:hypothetical protein